MDVPAFSRGRLVAGLLFAALGAGFLYDALGYWTLDTVYLWPVALIAIGVGEMFSHARRHQVEVVRSEQLGLAEDRVRIAQELHDIIAHSVSLMTVQVSAARRVFHTKPADAEKALAAAEETGRQSLTEIRNIVGVLRSADASIEAASLGEPSDVDVTGPMAPQPGLKDLPTLISGLQETGLNVRLDVVGEPPLVPQGTELAIYRIIQEALTNSMRYAGKADVLVRVNNTDTAIEISVVDNGSGASSSSHVAGHGLRGMRERALALGGTLEAGPGLSGKGWIVQASIPVPKT
ncbi:MAG: histidine kinase [Actinomycetota bacterium]